jgi:hypothetical protein
MPSHDSRGPFIRPVYGTTADCNICIKDKPPKWQAHPPFLLSLLGAVSPTDASLPPKYSTLTTAELPLTAIITTQKNEWTREGPDHAVREVTFQDNHPVFLGTIEDATKSGFSHKGVFTLTSQQSTAQTSSYEIIARSRRNIR